MYYDQDKKALTYLHVELFQSISNFVLMHVCAVLPEELQVEDNNAIMNLMLHLVITHHYLYSYYHHNSQILTIFLIYINECLSSVW